LHKKYKRKAKEQGKSYSKEKRKIAMTVATKPNSYPSQKRNKTADNPFIQQAPNSSANPNYWVDKRGF
jgi:hypothetical protein